MLPLRSKCTLLDALCDKHFSEECVLWSFLSRALGGRGCPECPAWQLAMWLWGPPTRWPTYSLEHGLSATLQAQPTLTFWEFSWHGHQSLHVPLVFDVGPDPTTHLMASNPLDGLLFAGTPEGKRGLAQRLWISSSLVKPANSSVIPWAESHLLQWGLKPWQFVLPWIYALSLREPYRVSSYLIVTLLS